MPRPATEKVLDAIYDAAADPSLWSRAMEKLGDRFGGAAILAGLQEGHAAFAATARVDEAVLALFISEYTDFKTNPTLNYLFTHPPGSIFDFLRLFGKEKFIRTDFYRDIYTPQKFWPLAHGLVFREDNLIAPFGMASSHRRDELGAGEVEELTFWFKHLARSMRVTARLVKEDWQRQGLRALLDRLGLGVMLVGPDGRVALMNAAAEEIVCAGDGLQVSGGRLLAARPDERSLLARLIAAACDRDTRGGGVIAVSRPSGGPPYGVEVAALSFEPALGSVAAVFASDPLRKVHSSAEQIAALLGLTPAEARVALKVAEGVSLVDSADELGVSLNTLKTLLKRIFAKTDTRRQSELAARIAATLPELRQPPVPPRMT